MNISTAIGFAIGVALLYLLACLFLVPKRFWLRLLVNALLGLGALGVIRWIGPALGVTLGLNAVTALTAGFMGLPGLIMMVLLQSLPLA